MNDDELDEMLRGLTSPKGPEELGPPQRLPIGELVVFSLLALVLLAWVIGTLGQIFSV